MQGNKHFFRPCPLLQNIEGIHPPYNNGKFLLEVLTITLAKALSDALAAATSDKAWYWVELPDAIL